MRQQPVSHEPGGQGTVFATWLSGSACGKTGAGNRDFPKKKTKEKRQKGTFIISTNVPFTVGVPRYAHRSSRNHNTCLSAPSGVSQSDPGRLFFETQAANWPTPLNSHALSPTSRRSSSRPSWRTALALPTLSCVIRPRPARIQTSETMIRSRRALSQRCGEWGDARGDFA
jgi:hypothetical protein